MTTSSRMPTWLQARAPANEASARMRGLIQGLGLHTVCDSALCPNCGDCFSRGTATFMILGDTCTRNCAFCAVQHGRPLPPNPAEPASVAEAVRRLGLKHAVVTSVTRDDLPDGGAAHFAATIRAVKALNPLTTIEVLIPDFGGSEGALGVVLDASPDVLNHNLETVPRLYPEVRPQASYARSLKLLGRAKELAPQAQTKSGIMLGLGETRDEIIQVLKDLRDADCDLVTLGQYLRPSAQHHPIARFVPPEEFEDLKRLAEGMGFRGVASGPLVRSSFHAEELLRPDIPGDAPETRTRCLVLELGLVDYSEALKLQHSLVRARQAQCIEDCLLLLQHPPVITLGASARPSDILASPEQLQSLGISVVTAERGGRATYHGPGQLVGYPIMDLNLQDRDLHRYLHNLEQAIILTLKDYGLAAQRKPGFPGVWVEGRKIAAIGVAVRRWVAFHGFALNINPDLSHFDLIDPCGLGRDSVTSLQQLLHPLPLLSEVKNRLLFHFGDIFRREMVRAQSPELIKILNTGI